MKATMTVAVHEFRTMYRRRMFQIVSVGLPVVTVLALSVLWLVQTLQGDEGVHTVGYLDQAALFPGHRTQGDFQFVEYPARRQGMGALLAEKIERLYVIPGDYLDTGLVERIEVGLGLSLDGGTDRALRGFVLDNLSDTAPDSEMIERLKEPFVLVNVAVDSEGLRRDLDEPRVFFFLGLAVLLIFSLAMTGGFLLHGLGEEKESRIMEILLSSVTPVQFMLGKVVGLGSAGLSQILLWVVSGRVILWVLPSVSSGFSFSLPGLAPTLLAVIFFVMGYLLFATLMAGVGAISPTIRESQQLAILVTLPLIAPIYGWIFIVENPTAGIVRAITYFPLTAPVVVLQRLGPGAIEPWEVTASLGVLALSVVAAVVLISRVFRAYLLMYGKRPSLRALLWTLARG